MAGFMLFLLLLFAGSIIDFGHFLFDDICFVLFASLAIPAMYSSLIRISEMENYRYFILLPFLVTIVSDMAALAAGSLFGKHKLALRVSPKKTVEGSIGSFILCVGFLLLYGFVLERFFSASVNYPLLLLYGALGNLFSQLGDLSFSVIKREYNIKDFGKLMPGHGGVLDRFDSLLFVAPLMELLIVLLPAITVL